MENSEKRIQELKELLEKKKGTEVSYKEAAEGYQLLKLLAELAIKSVQVEKEREAMLKESPKGIKIMGANTCGICSSLNQENWYDKWGLRCLVCQEGIARKEIPASLINNKEAWYSIQDLNRLFGLKGATLNKMIKDGILKVRTVTKGEKRVHLQLFLVKENKETLPPKKLVKGGIAIEIIDGRQWYCHKSWYNFVEPYEHLKKYKISNYLKLEK